MKSFGKKDFRDYTCIQCRKVYSETLDSIIKQSYKNREIILVENGSKDRSSDIIQEYEEKYRRFI